ncbi:MAG: hypothetical protein NTX04_08135 [Verrucomicrobia bacterium]|nr:hypothetical protein [Verrucomicrobiota bacterium]
MMAMAQAAMAQARLDRKPPPGPMKGMPPKTSQMAKSEGGAGGPAGGPEGAVPEMEQLKKGAWGKLPPKMAEDLSKAQSEGIAGEYRDAVQTYYRVIAEKSKKP